MFISNNVPKTDLVNNLKFVYELNRIKRNINLGGLYGFKLQGFTLKGDYLTRKHLQLLPFNYFTKQVIPIHGKNLAPPHPHGSIFRPLKEASFGNETILHQ